MLHFSAVSQPTGTIPYFTLRNLSKAVGKEGVSSCRVNTLHLARRPANRMQRATSQRRLPLETIWPSVLANELPPKIWHTAGTPTPATTLQRQSLRGGVG